MDKIIFDAQNRCWCIEKKINKNAVQLFNKGFINQMFYPEHGSMMQCLVQFEIMHEKGLIKNTFLRPLAANIPDAEPCQLCWTTGTSPHGEYGGCASGDPGNEPMTISRGGGLIIDI